MFQQIFRIFGGNVPLVNNVCLVPVKVALVYLCTKNVQLVHLLELVVSTLPVKRLIKVNAQYTILIVNHVAFVNQVMVEAIAL